MGFLSDIVDGFTGKAQARELGAAKKKSDKALKTGFDGQNAMYDDAIDDFSPFVQNGMTGNNMYSDAIGLNGVDKMREVVAQFGGEADPFAQFNQDNTIRAINRNANASGQFGSGVAALASARATNESNTRNWNAMLDRWNGVGQQAYDATGKVAGMKTAKGDNAYNYGATKAGVETNFGNAMAANKGVLTNNLMGVAGLATKFYNPSPVKA